MNKRISIRPLRFLALLLALTMAFTLSVNVSAAKGYKTALSCADANLTEAQKKTVLDSMSVAAVKSKCNVGIIVQDDLNGKESGEVADGFLDAEFGKNTDSIVLMLTTDPDGFDYITVSGAAFDKYINHLSDIYDRIYDALDVGGYYQAMLSFCEYLSGDSAGADTAPPTAERFRYVLADYDDSLTTVEEGWLNEMLADTAAKAECHIGVVITDDLNGKSSQRYADDFADEQFGYGSNNIVLLLDNDTEYDYISAYGRGTDIMSGKIDRTLDEVHDGLDTGFYEAVEAFCKQVDKYSDIGNDYYYDYEDNYSYYDDDEAVENFIFSWIVPLVLALIVALIITFSFTGGYTKRQPASAKVYLDSSRINFTNRQDIFVREYTTSHTSSSSSGGGRRGGGGGRSRSGRSGGGRHR